MSSQALERETPPPGEAGIGRVQERDMPEPAPLRKLVGPSVILLGVGIATGEYVLYPYIASKAGLVFLWAAVVGILTQYFINMEIERYTLATGETAVTGFQRLWKPFGLLMVACAVLPTMWPAWATSAATITTFFIGGGDANVIAIAGTLAIGVALTASPVGYTTVERPELIKIGAVLVFIVVALLAAVGVDQYADLGQAVSSVGTFPSEIEFAILAGALAASGAGGATTSCRATGSATRATGWAATPRAWSPP